MQACALNFAGKTCNVKNYNVQTQTEARLPNAQVPVVRPAPTIPAPAPAPNPVVSTGRPTPALNEAFMSGSICRAWTTEIRR